MNNIVPLITNDALKKSIADINKLVLIYFWAEWCAPCRSVYPSLKKISQKFFLKIKIYKMNVDTNSILAREYRIKSIPTFLLFHKSRIIKRFIGLISEEDISNINFQAEYINKESIH